MVSNLGARTILNAILHYGTWLVTLQVVQRIFADSPAAGAYGMLSAWWATLYVGRLANIGLPAIAPLCAIVVLAELVSLNALTLSTGEPLDLIFTTTSAILRAIALVSPILVNAAVQKVTGLVHSSLRARSTKVRRGR